jgi:hypothetical protein
LAGSKRVASIGPPTDSPSIETKRPRPAGTVASAGVAK